MNCQIISGIHPPPKDGGILPGLENKTDEDCKKLFELENTKIIPFLKELVELYKKHDISISHEDFHGGFLFELYNEENVDWILRGIQKIINV